MLNMPKLIREWKAVCPPAVEPLGDCYADVGNADWKEKLDQVPKIRGRMEAQFEPIPDGTSVQMCINNIPTKKTLLAPHTKCLSPFFEVRLFPRPMLSKVSADSQLEVNDPCDSLPPYSARWLRGSTFYSFSGSSSRQSWSLPALAISEDFQISLKS